MSRQFYETLRSLLASGGSALMATVTDGTLSGHDLTAEKAFLCGEKITPQNPALEGFWRENFRALGDGPLPRTAEVNGVSLLAEQMSARQKLIICGGGHIAVPLCEICAMLDFDVTIIDDRPEFANRERFPAAKEILCLPFDDAMRQIHYGDGSYFVIITRGHKDDRLCLTKILDHRFSYCGMIGSRKKVKVVMDQLRQEGYADDLLARVYSPIGLRIGAETPAEIAVCIAAQIIQVRSGASGGGIAPDALAALADGRPAVLATIIGKEGSAPRGLGAKLLIYADGTLSGTIGGGAGEARVISLAPDVLAEGRARIVKCNMTNRDATQDGMVCGGILRVLMEPV
ncbi:XdhC family protein [Anaerotruncus rubiinfantis]|uniref:XdhC family protein n=1 Tax=Anaerotruncus rubiinfantis TaxID=1720200 RepID=UPI001896F8FE|nr:XdhC/CoxI family protein [Anaerotruncus rubiinfantis]